MKYGFYAKHLQKYMNDTAVNTSDPTTSQKALLTMDINNDTFNTTNFNIAPEGGIRNKQNMTTLDDRSTYYSPIQRMDYS